MAELVDMLGKRLGKWTVMERVPTKGRAGARWRVLCDCGAWSVVLGKQLRREKHPSTRCSSCATRDYYRERKLRMTPAQLQERFARRKERVRKARRALYLRQRGLPPDHPLRKIHDLTGAHFGEWTVLYRAENCPSGKPRWMCRCSCGFEAPREGHSLTRGHTTACRTCGNRRIAANRRRFHRMPEAAE